MFAFALGIAIGYFGKPYIDAGIAKLKAKLGG